MFRRTIAPPLSAGLIVSSLFLAKSFIACLSSLVVFCLRFVVGFLFPRSISLMLMKVSKFGEPCGGFHWDFCLNFKKFVVLTYGLILSRMVWFFMVGFSFFEKKFLSSQFIVEIV